MNNTPAKLLSVEDIERAQSIILDIQKQFKEHVRNMDIVISKFSKEEIVETFFESGDFGNDIKERLEELKKELLRYHENIVDATIKTKEFLTEQMRLNNQVSERY